MEGAVSVFISLNRITMPQRIIENRIGKCPGAVHRFFIPVAVREDDDGAA